MILRTSWVYGPQGNNFMLTMLKLAATKEELRVVDDQRGAPTSSRELARATLDLFTRGERSRVLAAADVERVKEASGVYHATAAGETTWFGFAQAIFERARQADARRASSPSRRASIRPPRGGPPIRCSRARSWKALSACASRRGATASRKSSARVIFPRRSDPPRFHATG